MDLTITLPFPPSVNHYWRSKYKNNHIVYYVSPEGRAFRRKVYESLLAYRSANKMDSGMVLYPSQKLFVGVQVFPPNNRRRDIDNLLKALLDAMQAARVYGDDNQIDVLTIGRYELDQPYGRCEVQVSSLGLEKAPE